MVIYLSDMRDDHSQQLTEAASEAPNGVFRDC